MAETARLNASQGHEIAINFILDENKKHGYKRCKGEIGIDKHRQVYMTRCERWECWRCIGGRVWNEKQRILIATQFMQSVGDVYFVTISFDSVPNVSYHQQQKQFIADVAKLLSRWNKKASRDGQILHYALAYGIKPSNGEIHAHMACNYIPDIESSATKTYPDRVKTNYATNCNLDLWIEMPREIIAISLYTAENLDETIGADVIPSFQRVRTSKYMPKLRKKNKWSVKTRLWVENYGRGRITANFGNLKPIKIPKELIDDVLKLGATVKSSAEPITRENEVAQNTLSYIHTKSSSDFRFYEITPLVKCSRCKRNLPHTDSYFEHKSKGKRGLTSQCIHCMKYDRERVSDFDRRIDRAITNADKNAWCGEKLKEKKSELVERWTDDTCDCFYCDRPMHKDDLWELDHVHGTNQHGGQNVIDNVEFCCPECHKQKTASGLDGIAYLATIGKRKRGWSGVVQLTYLVD